MTMQDSRSSDADGIRTQFKVLSALLSYPDTERFSGWLADAKQAAIDGSDKVLLEAIEGIASLPRDQLTRIYVDTFDMREKTSLYLTAHELGESRERGAALVHLHMILREEGYETATSELPDYLPSLFELFAEVSDEELLHNLKCRVGIVCRAIEGRMEACNPYQKLFKLVIEILPDERIDESPSELAEQYGESAVGPFRPHDVAASDVNEGDPMPYPLVYD